MANESNLVAACPKCRARYRIEAGSLKPGGVRLRCSQCDAVFRVTPPRPVASVATPSAEPERVEVPPVEQTPVEAPSPPAAVPDLPRPEPRGPVVVVADSDVEAGKRTAQALAEWGYTPVLVHDGVEAILTIQRQLPPAVVLDAGLTKMFGFQVCELMKRNESLRSIHVVLVGSVHHEGRYRREPSDLYGADAYLERPQLPEALRATLRGVGVGSDAAGPAGIDLPAPDAGEGAEPLPSPVPPAPVVPPPVAAPPVAPTPEPSPVEPETSDYEAGPEPIAPPPSVPEDDAFASSPIVPEPSEPAAAPVAPEPAPASTDEVSPSAPEPAVPSGDDAGEEQAAAQRLARIIVSDIILYNAERFEAGLQSGDVVGALSAELDEGRSLLAQRVSPRLRESCDFLVEELLRVARERGMSS